MTELATTASRPSVLCPGKQASKQASPQARKPASPQPSATPGLAVRCDTRHDPSKVWTAFIVSFFIISTGWPGNRSSCTRQAGLIRPLPRHVVQPEGHVQ